MATIRLDVLLPKYSENLFKEMAFTELVANLNNSQWLVEKGIDVYAMNNDLKGINT
ncbi:MAG: hypothetical protein IPJ60_09805 [Sphingobacteriaceae bacterium]|nr:hypothetical protein [Sphingobacteriaceae bacterium]